MSGVVPHSMIEARELHARRDVRDRALATVRLWAEGMTTHGEEDTDRLEFMIKTMPLKVERIAKP